MTSRILVLDTAAQTHNSYIPLALVEALDRDGSVSFVRQAGYGDAVDLFRRKRCDTILALGGAGGDLAILGRLCAMAARSAIWITEDPYELEENLRVSAPFDLAFTNDLSCLPAYGRRGRHLPLAASRAFHDLTPLTDDADFLYDVCFVGTAWPNRVRTIDRILAGIGRPLRMKIGLPGNPHLPTVALSDPSLSTDWRVPNPELARIVNRSRVTLNLERKFSSARADQFGGSTPPPRLFENALAGGFQISLSSGSEAKRYFDPETEVAFCESDAALVERIAWALDHPDARIAMAQAARRRAKAEHLYDHRLAGLLSELRRLPPSAPSEARAPDRPARRKRLLIVTHNVDGQKPGGGIEIYQRELAAGLAGFDVYTLFPHTADGGTAYTLIPHRTGEWHRYGVPHEVGVDILHDAAHERVFEQILIENGIDLVHFQHLLGMPLSLPIIARACGVPTALTLHDFYLTCSRFNLIDYRGRFCDIAARSPTECDVCLAASGVPAGAQQRRRNFISGMLGSLDAIVANSPYSVDYLKAIYPNAPAERIRIVEMLTPESYGLPIASPSGREAVLRVAVPGNFTRAKGADTIIRILCLLKDDPVDFLILGAIQDRSLAEHLRGLALPRVSVHGGYTPSELPRLMAGSDVSLHLSIWPETYMISLNEAWAAGAVPIVSHLGAPGERVRDGVDGFTVDPDDAGRVCDLIRELAADRAWLQGLRRAALDRRFVSPAEHVEQLAGLYADLIARHPVSAPAVPLRVERDYILSARACGIRTNTPIWTQDGHGWDEAAPPPRAERAARNLGLWRTFPLRLAHLAREAASTVSAHHTIDRFDFDICPAQYFGGSARQKIRLNGWAFAPDLGRALDVVLQIEGRFRKAYAVCSSLARPDVSAYFGQSDAEMSGFDFDIDVSELHEGHYEVRLMQVYDGVIVEFDTLGEIAITGSEAIVPMSAPPPYPDLCAARPVDGEAVITRLDASSGADDATALVLEGWAFDRQHRRVLPEVHVGFFRQGRTPVWFPAARVRAPASLAAEDPLFTFAGLQTALSHGALESGLYRIVVAERGDGQSLLHETGAAVMVLQERFLGVHSCGFAVGGEDSERPGIGGSCESDAELPDHCLYLDHVETDADSPRVGTFVSGDHLYLRGWAYVPSLGRADSLALHIFGPQRSLKTVLPAVQRADVAEHLGADAAWAGFEALVPLTALPSGLYGAELHYASADATAALPLDLNIERAVPLAA